MARPSGHADRLMIAAAKEIAQKRGLSGLTIREVVTRAGVNLGMFHYYFKNRERFDRTVLQELYGEFFGKLTTISRKEANSLEQLREALLFVAHFVRDNRRIAIVLFKDILNGDRQVVRFSSEKMPPHAELIRELIERCVKDGSLPPTPIQIAMPLFFGAIGMPALVSEIMKMTGQKKWFPAEEILSDEAIEQRIDVILAGLRATGRKRQSRS